MKKWHFLTIMMVALISIGLASCSDDDEDELGSVSNEIVGTWKGSYSNRYFLSLTFNSDGTGSGERETLNKNGYVAEYWDYTFIWGRKGNKVNIKGSCIDVEVEEDHTTEHTYSYQFDYDGTNLAIHEGAFGRITSFTKQ